MAGRIEVDTDQLAAGRAEHAAVVGTAAEAYRETDQAQMRS